MCCYLIAADAFTPSARQVAILGILAAAFLYAYWYSRRRMSDGKWPKVARGDLETGASDATARKDLAKLVQQLDELSRQIEVRLDAKCAALEQAIHDGDKRISALRILLEAARAAGVQLSDLDPGSSSLKPQASSLPDDRNRRIYELADEGRNALQIAQELQQRIGEVELILNLREAAQTQSDRAA